MSKHNNKHAKHGANALAAGGTTEKKPGKTSKTTPNMGDTTDPNAAGDTTGADKQLGDLPGNDLQPGGENLHENDATNAGAGDTEKTPGDTADSNAAGSENTSPQDGPLPHTDAAVNAINATIDALSPADREKLRSGAMAQDADKFTPAPESLPEETRDPGHVASTAPEAPAKPLPQQLCVLRDSLVKLFDDRNKTSLPKFCERQVLEFAGEANKGIAMEFLYSNDEKTKGHIVLKEFEHEVRVPAEGEFDFGPDFQPKQ